ncbi:uncharacterized protein LOC9645002 [Selaginella moellendorffii]|uniref:uncharacterized protein LOC9645002 n=1 Tax=Selaginella moellendorffii TaxID=88036 RepID=UPI000D1C2645|nr:uncharacterized protein LOC9645002 [Selaginella moellendorffii]|eukprot:XP_024545642.1 uncharacterized protein LOC9645002 [Selaginella moellendorffii]
MLVNLVQCHGGSALDRAARSRSESPVLGGARTDSIGFARKSVSRVYVLDVHPLCYRGSKPDSSEFLWWMRAFLRRIVLDDPVIARRFSMANLGMTIGEKFFLLTRSLKAVIASPDKDFKQLVSENVELLIPFADLRRWSFYTVKDYVEQHKCEPVIELGLPLKLMRKHGSLENLLSAAAIRTVGKPYIQDALKEHSVLLEKNLEVLSLRRDKSNDLAALQWLEKELEMLQRV